MRGVPVPDLPRHVCPGDEPPRAPGPVQPHERPRVGLRAGLHPAARLREGPPRRRPAALRPGDLHAAGTVRRGRVLAPVRDLLYERPDHAGPGRDRPACRKSRRRRHPGDRGRARRAEPRAAGPVHRPVRGRRRRAQPAYRVRPLEGHAGLGDVPRGQARPHRRGGRLGLCPPVLRADLQRRGRAGRDRPAPRRRARDDPRLRDRRLQRVAPAGEADRPVRGDHARPHRHRDHARVPLAVPLLPVHRDQDGRSAIARSRPS